jgi:hypothetical protein
LELAVDPETSDARRKVLLADLEKYFDEQWGAGKTKVRPSTGGVSLELVADELPQRFEQMQARARQPRERMSRGR